MKPRAFWFTWFYIHKEKHSIKIETECLSRHQSWMPYSTITIDYHRIYTGFEIAFLIWIKSKESGGGGVY